METEHPVTRLLPFLVCALCAFLGSCRDGAPDRGSTVPRDSAGIRIVEHPEPQGVFSDIWELDATPFLRVGGLEGSEETGLDRVADATLAPWGALVVLDGAVQAVRIFDLEGRQVATSGRRGQGYSEYTSLSWIEADRDSLVVYDKALNRVSWLDRLGGFARSVHLETSDMAVQVGRHADGTFYALERLPPARGGLSREHKNWVRLSTTGEERAVLGAFPGDEEFIFSQPRGFYVFPQPFGRASFFETRGTDLYVAVSDAFEIRRYDSRGRLLGIVRMALSPRPVEPAHIEAWKSSSVAGVTDDLTRRLYGLAHARMSPAATMPAFQSLKVDPLGYLWVEAYRAPDEEEPRWFVFDDAGVFAGRMSTPRGLTVLEIGEGHVLGLSVHGNDVESVDVYRLRRARHGA